MLRRPVRRLAAVGLGTGALALSLLAPVTTAAATTTVGATTTVTAAIGLPEVGSAIGARAGQSVRAPGSVLTGSKIAVRGKVKTRKGLKRPVRLSVKQGTRWKVVAKARTTRKGGFRVRTGAGSTARTVRLTLAAPRYRGLKAYSRRFRVQVVAPVAPPPPVPPKTTTAVSESWSNTPAVLGAPGPTVTGQVSGTEIAGRQVVVQQQLGNDWFTATSVASGADGSFSLALPTTWLHTTPVRVVVEETATALGAVSAATGVAVTPSWVPQGADREAWTQIDTRYRWRYDPCQSIEYRTNFAGAPNFARDALRSALAEITQATGHEFVHLGESNGIQNPEPGYPGTPDDTELLIGFLRDEWTTNVYGETAIGRGGPDKGMWASDAKGAVNRITKGTAFLDLAPSVPWTPELMRFVFLHELTHAMGLGHSPDLSQVMFASGDGKIPHLGVADLNGLNQQGLQAGCVVDTPRRPSRAGGLQAPAPLP